MAQDAVWPGPGQIQDAGVWRATINAYKGDTDKTSLAAKAWRNHIQPGPGSLTMSGSQVKTVSGIWMCLDDRHCCLPLGREARLVTAVTREAAQSCLRPPVSPACPVSGQPGVVSREPSHLTPTCPICI